MEDKLAQFRAEELKNKDGFQLDLFHYLDDPIITENKLPKLNKDEKTDTELQEPNLDNNNGIDNLNLVVSIYDDILHHDSKNS